MVSGVVAGLLIDHCFKRSNSLCYVIIEECWVILGGGGGRGQECGGKDVGMRRGGGGGGARWRHGCGGRDVGMRRGVRGVRDGEEGWGGVVGRLLLQLCSDFQWDASDWH